MKSETKFFFTLVLIIAISTILGWTLNNLYYSLKPTPENFYPQQRIGLEKIYYYQNLTCFDLGNFTIVEFTDTHSMEPTLSTKALAIKTQINPDEIKIGDIISFKMGDDKIIHRVIGIENNKFITKGDNVKLTDDYKVSPEDVTGVIVAIIY